MENGGWVGFVLGEWVGGRKALIGKWRDWWKFIREWVVGRRKHTGLWVGRRLKNGWTLVEMARGKSEVEIYWEMGR